MSKTKRVKTAEVRAIGTEEVIGEEPESPTPGDLAWQGFFIALKELADKARQAKAQHEIKGRSE